MILKEDKIIKGINNGNHKDFHVFYEKHYKIFCQFAFRFVNDFESSRDIVQDAFINTWDKKHTFQEITHIKSYIYKTIRNRCLNYIRNNNVSAKNKDEIEYLGRDSVFRNILIEEETYSFICEKIESLPYMQKEVIELHIDGLSNEEIAHRLNINVNTVRTHKLRAKKILKSDLKKLLIAILYYWC